MALGDFGSWLSGAIAAVVDSIAAVISTMRWAINAALQHIWVVICTLLGVVAYIWAKIWSMVKYAGEVLNQIQEKTQDPQTAVDAGVVKFISALEFLNYVVDVELVAFTLLAGAAWCLGLVTYRVIKSFIPTMGDA